MRLRKTACTLVRQADTPKPLVLCRISVTAALRTGLFKRVTANGLS